MKKYKELIIIGLILITASLMLYYVNYAIFHDLHHIVMYFTEEIAFIPVEILIVTLIIDRLIERREKMKVIEKLNMVIGVFFNEVGEELLSVFISLDTNIQEIKNELAITNEWKQKDYKKARNMLKNYEHKIQSNKVNIDEIGRMLCENKDFFIKLLENPVLLEHETFTDLLQALFHIYGEIVAIKKYPDAEHRDAKHIDGDIQRAYSLISYEWLVYMEYVQKEYPYLFSTALMHNPYLIE